MALAGVAASGAAAAAAAKEIFDYNRENFMEDREQRMKKEFAERRYRVKQAGLWREDVRGFVELTERKMSIYLLVNMLMLGFTFNLWCEGRLPEQETPVWLLMGNQLATVGAFSFLLVTVWLAMHASVSARSYLTRVLTQLVRLPIPSWEELEACRTYGSDFERLEAKQMFRVPFLMRRQERIAQSSAAAVEAAADAAAAEMSESQTGLPEGSEQMTMATDPWGLERWSHNVYELGCDIGSDVAKLRHIKLMRQAAVYWQTYDAFSRVSMSIGVNQLMLAISYYILGYACIEVRAPMAGFGGVLILMGGALILAYIDLTLPPVQRRLIFSLLLIGPIISCLAAWNAARGTDLSKRVAECLAPVAFFAHGIVIALLALVLRVREQENGAMLPLAFQGVLYLDVFGWVSHKSAVEEGPTRSRSRIGTRLSRAATGPLSLADEQRSHAPSNAMPASQPRTPQRQAVADEEPSSYYAAGYEDVEAKGVDPEVDTGEFAPKPALASISYDDVGRPIPTRPEEMARNGAVHDLRFMPGAPRQWDEVNALEPAGKSFWNPVTFMPPESRRRRQMDELLDAGSDGTGPSEADMAEMDERGEPGTRDELENDDSDKIITGHDHESPGQLPWEIFKLAALVSSLAWIIGGAYFTLVVNDIVNMSKALPWVKSEFPMHHPKIPGAKPPHFHLPGLLQAEKAVPEHSILSLWASALTGQQLGPAAEPVDVVWPYPTISPRSLSCDSSGQHLLVSDGLSLYMAELSAAGMAVATEASQQTGLRQQGSGEAMAGKQQARFHALPRCQALSGKKVQDAAVACNRTGDGSSQRCRALALLHGRGAGLADCSLTEGTNAPSMKSAAAISKAWLQSSPKRRNAWAAEAEAAMWLMVDPKCRPREGHGGGCTSVWTTHGRVARLRRRASGAPEMVPSSIYELEGDEMSGSDTNIKDSRVVRAFNSRFLGVLHPDLQSIHVFDAGTDGESHSATRRGSVWLPMQDPVASFCAGGGFLYLLGKGPGPAVWRVPLPMASLSSEL